jgi:hypothetical protein
MERGGVTLKEGFRAVVRNMLRYGFLEVNVEKADSVKGHPGFEQELAGQERESPLGGNAER